MNCVIIGHHHLVVEPQMAWCGGVLERHIYVVISGAKTAVVLILQDVEMCVGIVQNDLHNYYQYRLR